MERMSSVDARRLAAMSCGLDRTYGWSVSAAPIAAATWSTGAPAARTRSTRVTASTCVGVGSPSATLSSMAVRIGRTTVRPPEPSSGPSPVSTPATVTLTGAPAPRTESVSPTSSPSVRASVSVMSAVRSASPASGLPRLSGRSRTRGSATGSMPRTVTGAASTGLPACDPRNVLRSMAGAVAAIPPTPASSARVAADRPFSSNAVRRRSARPTIEATVRSIEASRPASTPSAATSTPTPSAIPTTVSTVRARRAASARQA